MESFLELFNQYARTELMVLVPVLLIIIKFLYISKIKNKYILSITTTISVLLCLVYTFSIVPIDSIQSILLAAFTSVTQGILFAGASVLGG